MNPPDRSLPANEWKDREVMRLYERIEKTEEFFREEFAKIRETLMEIKVEMATQKVKTGALSAFFGTVSGGVVAICAWILGKH